MYVAVFKRADTPIILEPDPLINENGQHSNKVSLSSNKENKPENFQERQQEEETFRVEKNIERTQDGNVHKHSVYTPSERDNQKQDVSMKVDERRQESKTGKHVASSGELMVDNEVRHMHHQIEQDASVEQDNLHHNLIPIEPTKETDTDDYSWDERLKSIMRGDFSRLPTTRKDTLRFYLSYATPGMIIF